MTTKQLRDLVYAKYPDVGETMVDKFLEEGMRALCQQSFVYKGVYDYTTTGNTTRFKLDSDVLSVDVLYLRDAFTDLGAGEVIKKISGNPIAAKVTTDSKVYWIEQGFLVCGTMSDGQFVAIPSGKRIIAYTRTIPDNLSAGLAQYDEPDGTVTNGDGTSSASLGIIEGSANVPGIPEQFHILFAYYAMMMIAEIASDWNAAQYFNARFAAGVRDARKFASRNVDGNFTTVPHYY